MRLAERFLVTPPALFRRLLLRVGGVVDRRSILCAHVVALAHALRGVVRLEERLEQRLVAHLAGVVDHADHLGVTGATRAHLFVGGIGRKAAGVSHGRGDHARDLPELALGAPETAQAEHRFLEPARGRLLDVRTVDEVSAGQRHRRIAAGQRLVLRGNRGLLAEEGHGGSLERKLRGSPECEVDMGITQDRPTPRLIAP